MIKIAVTGGIGSGKSYISHLLENMHIPVYNADNEAKRLTVFDAGIRGELIALLGPNCSLSSAHSPNGKTRCGQKPPRHAAAWTTAR